jgi:hypothetical protein
VGFKALPGEQILHAGPLAEAAQRRQIKFGDSRPAFAPAGLGEHQTLVIYDQRLGKLGSTS